MKLFLGIFLFIAIALRAEENTSMQALRALVDAERGFARAATERGIRDSFLQFLADDSLVFDPAPTSGKRLYAGYDDKGRKLIWQPVFATTSQAADLGYTTGPWELKKSATDQTPIAFGQFLSIWKKQPDNSWKVIIDVGIDNPQPTEPPTQVQLLPPSGIGNADPNIARLAWEKAEKNLANASKIDTGAALAAAASDDIRVFRNNSFPAVGKTAAKLMLSSDHRKTTRETSGGGISRSNDLAYRYGSYATERGIITERGYYLSIWRTDLNGDWKLVIDLQKKSPDAKEK